MAEPRIDEQITRTLTPFQKMLIAAVVFVLMGGGAARLYYAHAELTRVKTEIKLDRNAVKPADAACAAGVPETGAGARSFDSARKLAPGQKIDVNTAGAADFQRIPGIGPSYAARIVELRKQRGPFKKIEELMLVKGIGEGRFKRIKSYV